MLTNHRRFNWEAEKTFERLKLEHPDIAHDAQHQYVDTGAYVPEKADVKEVSHV